MGWGTEQKCLIYFNRLEINSNHEALDKIYEEETTIKDCIGQLKILIGSTPKDIIPEEWKDDPTIWLNNQADELLNTMHDSVRLVTDLRHYINDKLEE